MYCPLCGARLGYFSSDRVFFDIEKQEYRLWTDYPGTDETDQVEPIGKLKIRIRCRPIDVHDCFFKRIFLFCPESSGTQSEPPHFSPLRPEFEHLIRDCSSSGVPTSHHRSYNVTTFTGWRAHVTRPCHHVRELSGESGAALFIWPNFTAPGWKKYYIAFYPPGVPQADGTGNLKAIYCEIKREERSTFTEVPFDHGIGAQILDVPSRIVLCWIIDDVEYFSGWKTNVQRQDVPHLTPAERVQAHDVSLGFDFGTTNTAAAIYYGLSEERRLPLASLAIHDRTLHLLAGRVSQDIQWLPQPEHAVNPLATLPSQILFDREDLLRQATPNLIAPHQFTIPYYQEEGSLPRSIGQFKWAKALGPLRINALTYRCLYLRLSLEIFLAEVVAQYGIMPGPLTLISTFPLAFTSEDIQLHDQSFDRIRPSVQESTGFQLTMGPRVDESHAGQRSDITHVKGTYSLFVDVGGGTTDICISFPDDGSIYVVDSIEYGGEDLNNAILRDALTDLSPQQFRRQIRTRGAETFRSTESFCRDAQKWQKATHIRTHLQRGLIECIARFCAAQAANLPDSRLEFRIFMLGLGWLTFFAEESSHERIAGCVSNKVGIRMEELHSAGIAAKIPIVECVYPSNPKTVVARGAARSNDHSRAPTEASAKSYLLEDVYCVRKTGTDTVYPWTTPTPVYGQGAIDRLEPYQLQKFGFETSCHMPDGVPWEQQRLDDGLCVYPNDTIFHSPFRVFLSRYKDAY